MELNRENIQKEFCCRAGIQTHIINVGVLLSDGGPRATQLEPDYQRIESLAEATDDNAMIFSVRLL